MSLDTIISDADKQVKDGTQGQPPPIPKDDGKPPVEEFDDGLNPDEIRNARTFYRGLKDPEKAPTLIEFIAKQAGYSKIETPQDLKEAKRDIRGILKEKLGDEFEPLIEKLAPALDEILKDKLEESTKSIREDIEADKRAKLQNESLSILHGISKQNYGGKDIPDNVSKEMNSLMEEFEPSPSMSMERYIKHIHTLAIGNLGLQPNNDRADRNRNDAAARLASDGKGSPSPEANQSTTKGLDQAVRAAVEKVEKELNK